MKKQKEITTNRLLKYLKGEVDQQEAGLIEAWASESEENGSTLLSLAKVYNLGQLARTYTEKEVEDAWKKTCVRAGVTPRAKKPLKRQWVFWSMAAAIALLVATNLALVLREPELCTDKAIILTSQQGKFVRYTLPDSTVVTLNHNSSLEFPMAFNGNERRVKLNGEGYFDVARDEEKPFIVETGKEIQIKVLGTEFNLQSFS
jgi:ferric-dicitrate binding protein FerR (iron transport regulator)